VFESEYGLRPTGCAEFKELLAGQRIRLHGLDALPNTSWPAPRCPAAPRCARVTRFLLRP